MAQKKKPAQRRYWIRFWYGECVVCGRGNGYRERVYGRKPKNPKERYLQLPDTVTYDYCLER